MAKLKIDKDVIRDLAALMDETGLSEIEWSEGDVLVRVGREVRGTVMPVAAATPAPAGGDFREPAGDDWSAHPGAVASPMVGTAYLAPEPGSAVFAGVGDTVTVGQTVMIVEAMKTMNPIATPVAGTVRRVLVANEQPVEFGQVLMIIE